MREIGVIVCENGTPSHLKFSFQIREDEDVKAGEYVEVPVGSRVLVGRIYLVHSYNEYYIDPSFVRDHVIREIPTYARFPTKMGRWRVAKARVVGVFQGEKLLPPEIAPEPGDNVFRANEELLKGFLGLSAEGAFVGSMRGNDNIRVHLDIDKLVRQHVAILGATGSGKSYTVGVLIEELLDHGLPVVVIDPHGEYKTIRSANSVVREIEKAETFGLKPRSYEIIEYTLPSESASSVSVLLPPSTDARRTSSELHIRLGDLGAEAISEVCGMTENQTDLVYLALKSLFRSGVGRTGTLVNGGGVSSSSLLPDFGIDELIAAVRRVADEWNFYKTTLVSVIRRLSVLRELGILGGGVDLSSMIKPGKLTVIDLSGEAEERVRRILTAAMISKIFSARKKGLVPPLLVVVEESHRFAPQEEDTYSKTILRKVAREGRKFGIGLCVTSQRIIGLDKDLLSQCGTKIILRIDSKTDLDFLAPFLDYGSKDDYMRIPYLPTGVAIISGVTVRTPVITEVRPRRSQHGGVGARLS